MPLTTTQVAALAGTTRHTVEREIKRGNLAADRIGRQWAVGEHEAARWAQAFIPYAAQRARKD